MAFVQVVVMEDFATPSGATLRNRANFEALSTLRWGDTPPQVVALGVDKNARSEAPTVLPLARSDVSRLIAACTESQPDFVVIEGVQLLQAAMALHTAFPALPIIIDMHNVESFLRAEIDRWRMPRALRPLMPVFLARRNRACRSAEQVAATIALQIWVCSEEDRKRLQTIVGDVQVEVVPNPIPAWAEHSVTRPSQSASDDVLFVGHLGYAPNVEAVELLVHHIMPRLKRLVPKATLHVCGRRPRRRLAAAVQSQGHRLTPDAKDLAAIYHSAGVAAVPLQTGGGTRLKILEAMAVGCPIVATPKAVEGLSLVPGVHYRPAVTMNEFAHELAELLSSRRLARQMATSSRSWVIEHFGESRRIESVEKALSTAGL